jgi:hypothetical protein
MMFEKLSRSNISSSKTVHQITFTLYAIVFFGKISFKKSQRMFCQPYFTKEFLITN